MKPRKLNIRTWYSLGLAAVLLVFALVAATGTTWARYRTDTSAGVQLSVRNPVSFYLGKVEYGENAEEADEGKFVQTDENCWNWNEDGCLQLDFAVANGLTETEFEKRNQQIRVRLIGTLGVQQDQLPMKLKLRMPKQEDPLELALQETTPPPETQTDPQQIEDPFDYYEATAVYISAGSPMFTTFGEGWVFRFLDEDGAELEWLLEGKEATYLEMSLILEGGTPADTSLLRLQIDGSYTSE